jgi:hypothetical protein
MHKKGGRVVKRYPAGKGPRKPAAKKAHARSARVDRVPPGYAIAPSGLAVPEDGSPVPPGKLRSGIAEAHREIQRTLAQVLAAFSGDFEIAEIEITASFSAEGKFLGFGVGGAASVKLKIRPSTGP